MTCHHLLRAPCAMCASDAARADAKRTGARARYRKGRDRTDSVRALQEKNRALRARLAKMWRKAGALLEV